MSGVPDRWVRREGAGSDRLRATPSATARRAGLALAAFVLVLVAFVLVLAATPSQLRAQVGALSASCADGLGSESQLACADGALAAHALQNGFGILMASGGPLPASPSTAGSRLDGSPRWILDGGFGWSIFRHPDLTDSQRGERRDVSMAPRLTVLAGVFEGFAPAATVGGVGAVDLIGEFRILPVPAMDGLDGRTGAWGIGTRVGIFRESFTLPGITMSVMHRRSGTLRYGGLPEDEVQVRLAPRVTSFRAVVGKDLWEIGVSGGVQWDRIRGDARLTVVDGDSERTSGAVALPDTRRTFFVGFNRTWVVAQLTGELGWSPAPSFGEDVAGTGSFSGPSSALTGALSFRITY